MTLYSKHHTTLLDSYELQNRVLLNLLIFSLVTIVDLLSDQMQGHMVLYLFILNRNSINKNYIDKICLILPAKHIRC